MDHEADIAVVGAGAAGLAAAIFAAQSRPGIRVVLLDGAVKIGAKILVSGGGRCNVTNVSVTPVDFDGSHRFVARVLRRFDQRAAVRWFESLGVGLKQEPTGKLFPVSDSAKTVLCALQGRCDQLGLPVLTGHRVTHIGQTPTGFRISHGSGHLLARRVIMATGGRSLPKTGSDGQGWSLVRPLGHTIGPTDPALVPLVLCDSFFHRHLSGVSHEAVVTTHVAGKKPTRRTGSLLWTHFGVSGPVVMDASGCWVAAHRQQRAPRLAIGFFPGQNPEQVDHWLSSSAGGLGDKTVATVLSQRLPNRLVQTLCAWLDRPHGQEGGDRGVGRSPETLATTVTSQLRRAQRRRLVAALTGLELPVAGDRGWNYAEVTAGGVSLREVNPDTMASRKVEGLYLIGEMLDCHGRIGGFNFQWAWATGYIAGCSAAQQA